MSFADLIQADPEGDEDVGPVSPGVRIQRDTLTAWVNSILSPQGLTVDQLSRDMRDGVKLCRLLEAVRGERIGKIIQKANIRPLEASGNISLVLDVMNRDGAWVTNAGESGLGGV